MFNLILFSRKLMTLFHPDKLAVETHCQDMQQAGTGFMPSMMELLQQLADRGYQANLVAKFDHFAIDSGAIILYPQDFTVDEIIRYENTSDPDDQAILYAICALPSGIKGVYIENYGINQDELSADMLGRLQVHVARAVK